MFVEPLEHLDLLTSDLSTDTWEGDEARRDAVWLAASEASLRRAFVTGGSISLLKPTDEDVRLAGATFGCALFLSCNPASAGLENVFVFTGDLLKWRNAIGDRLGEPWEYLALARRLAEATVDRWRGTTEWDEASSNRFARLQALIWSVQTMRIQPATLADLAEPVYPRVERLARELVLEEGPYPPAPSSRAGT